MILSRILDLLNESMEKNSDPLNFLRIFSDPLNFPRKFSDPLKNAPSGYKDEKMTRP